jgi:hypothetical protein
MKKFLKWWKVWGQVWGFVLLVALLNVIILNNDIQHYAKDNVWVGIVWLIMFFGGAGWYSWQMRVHGWKLPEDIRRTH